MAVLDWRPRPDDRNHRYRLTGLDCYAGAVLRANVWWHKAVQLDQGQEGACTGFGAAHVCAASPRARLATETDARELYYEARRQDEWTGEDYEGSSVLGAMQALKLRGWIGSYRWAYSLAEVRHGLAYHGPFEIGVWWHQGMIRPDANGMISATGERVGGHALMLAGYRTTLGGDRQYRLENSWGPEWGDDGGAWISESDLTWLAAHDGEFAIPLKTRVT